LPLVPWPLSVLPRVFVVQEIRESVVTRELSRARPRSVIRARWCSVIIPSVAA
ncbi:hypothetical protein PanWU01x14_101880, partial [Parasponia andersonii]